MNTNRPETLSRRTFLASAGMASAAVAAEGFAHHVTRPGNRGALTQGHLQHTQYEYGP